MHDFSLLVASFSFVEWSVSLASWKAVFSAPTSYSSQVSPARTLVYVSTVWLARLVGVVSEALHPSAKPVLRVLAAKAVY